MKGDRPDGSAGVFSLDALSRSPEETREIGFQLAQHVPMPGVVLLRGRLGTGKTTLTRGIASGLGLEDPNRVTSPSFSLVNIYQGRCLIYHVDLYRVEGPQDLRTIGIEEFLGQQGVTIVEWSERIPFPIQSDLIIELQDAGGDHRHIRVWKPATMSKSNTNVPRKNSRESSRKKAPPARRR